LSDLVASIDTGRAGGNLSSAIRLFVLEYYRAAALANKADGHAGAENGRNELRD
jgi:hypothetical protein